MDQTPSDLLPGAHSRRHVLGLAVAAGAGLPVLAGCGGDDTAAPAGADGTAESTSPAPSSSAADDPSPLVAAADVPVNGGVILDDRKIVVTQPVEGTFKAFSAVCTHRSCTVATVKDGVIGCECHFSAFSAADGSVRKGPATRPLKEIAVTVTDGEVVEA